MKQHFFLPFLALVFFFLNPAANAQQRIYGVTEIGTPEITPSFFAAPPPPFSSAPASSERAAVHDPRNAQSIAMTTAGVVEIGEADIDVPFVKHSGIDKPLTEALREILPKDWHAKKKPEVNRFLRLSWNKGMNWVSVINDIAIEYRLAILIDWDQKTVTVLNQYHDMPKFADSTVGVTNTNGKVFTVSEEKGNEMMAKQAAMKADFNKLPPLSSDKSHILQDNGKLAVAPITPVPAPIRTDPPLQLIKGEMMHKSFEQWVTKAGWNLVWDAKVDYVIPVSTTFSGSVEEIAIAFENSARASGLALHIEGKRLNRTIQVTDSH